MTCLNLNWVGETMGEKDFSKLHQVSQAGINRVEAFLEDKLGAHKPKIDFQASLKERLTRAKPFGHRNRLGKAWIAAMACALAGGAIYSLGYLLFRKYQLRA